MDLGRISGYFPGGRPSGLPDDIVERLVQAKQQEELQPIQKDINQAKQSKDVYSKLDSTAVNLVQAVEGLTDADAFQTRKATSSNTDAVSVSANDTAAEGTYSVHVTHTARAHNLLVGVDDGSMDNDVSAGVSDPNDAATINDGIEVSFFHQGTEHTYTTDSETTLSSLADAINDDDNGVSASITNINTVDNPQYVLSLKSQATGDGENQITTDSGGTTPGISTNDPDGSQTLFTGGTVEQETTQFGRDAEFSVDGVTYDRSSNEVDDVIQGVTLTLKSGGSDAEVTVDLDTSAITKKVQSFVDAYNKTGSFIDNQSSYNKETDQAGPLLGSSVARGLEMRMESTLMEPVTGTSDSAYQYLSQVGLEMQRDGSLAFDSGKFKDALETDRAAVEKLFAGENGAATKLENGLKGYTDSIDGIITSQIESIDNRIERLQDDYSEEQQDLKDYRFRMTQKFSEMEQAIMGYKSMEGPIANMMDMFKANSKA